MTDTLYRLVQVGPRTAHPIGAMTNRETALADFNGRCTDPAYAPNTGLRLMVVDEATWRAIHYRTERGWSS